MSVLDMTSDACKNLICNKIAEQNAVDESRLAVDYKTSRWPYRQCVLRKESCLANPLDKVGHTNWSWAHPRQWDMTTIFANLQFNFRFFSDSQVSKL